MRFRLTLFLTATILFMGAFAVRAQPESCPVFIETALTALGESCGDMVRGTICYGSNRVDATFFEAVEEVIFSQPNDRTDLVNIATVQTSALNDALQQWGIAVMNVQANVPYTLPGQAVTFLLIGDAKIENAVPPEEALVINSSLPLQISGSGRVNLRSGPGTNNNVVASLDGGTILQAVGRNEASDWLYVIHNMSYAWIASMLVGGAADASATLPVITDDSYTPMQAFYFSTGIGTSSCLEAPEMLVIQGPRGTRVNLQLNGREMNLGSTVVLMAERTNYAALLESEEQGDEVEPLNLPDETECLNTRVFVIDGDAQLGDGSVRVLPGFFTQSVACLSDDGIPDTFTPWERPTRFSQEELAQFGLLELIPDNLLHYPIEIPTDDEIDQNLNRSTTAPTTPPQTGGDDNDDDDDSEESTDQTQGFSCAGFRTTSPPDGGPVMYGTHTFYWDGIAGVDAYQVELFFLYEGKTIGSRMYRVGPNFTSVTVEFPWDEGFTRATHIQWRAQALQGAEPNFTSACETPYVTNPLNYQ